MTISELEYFWNLFLNNIKNENNNRSNSMLRIARVSFSKNVKINECYIIILAIMYQLYKYVYTTQSSYGKFTICYNMLLQNSDNYVTFTLGKAILFRDEGKDIQVYALIEQLVLAKAEEYIGAEISSISIHIYLEDEQDIPNKEIISNDDIFQKIWECINSNVVVEVREAKRLESTSKRSYPNKMTSVLSNDKYRLPFIVADTETVLINDIHVPYAVGFLVVTPDLDLSSKGFRIETYFSEDYPLIYFNTLSVSLILMF